MNITSKHREIKFVLAGVVLLVAVVGFIFYSINFLISKIKPVISSDVDREPAITRFNIEKFEKLILAGEETTEQAPQQQSTSSPGQP